MPENMAAIVGMGMVTAVGLDAQQSAASIRAGIARFEETSIHDKRFEPFVMAVLPDDVLPPLKPEIESTVGLTSKHARVLRLATSALKEATMNLPEMEKIPLYLGVAQQLPDRPEPFERDFLKQLSLQTDVAFNTAESFLFPHGRAAGLFALDKAMHAVCSGRHPYAIVGGVDTYVDLYLLGTLDMQERILGSYVMDGFIPGEGASFLVITTMDRARSDRLSPLGLLTMVAKDHEEGHLYSDQPYKGDGLANALAQLFQSSSINEPVKEVFTSMNGENHWAKEWGVAHMRNQAAFDPQHGFHHPADCIGDTGAASGIILTTLAAIGIIKRYHGSPSLIICSSDYGERAAVGVLKA
jgi:3-oxoacyl-[acyl-carrier-protein] synthase-1